MRPAEIASAIREALTLRGTTAYRASLDAGLPGNAIRYALERRATKSDRLAEICDALGLEFYVGPPRDARPQAVELPGLSQDSLRDLETGARALNRVVAEAGGDPVPDDLWPVLAARRGPGAEALADNDNLAPGARPVDVVELAAAAGGGAEALGEEIAGCVWFRQDWLASRGLDPAQCAVIRVVGESMEPLLNEGDFDPGRPPAPRPRGGAYLRRPHRRRAGRQARRARPRTERGCWSASIRPGGRFAWPARCGDHRPRRCGPLGRWCELRNRLQFILADQF